jgi:hypothetical protein
VPTRYPAYDYYLDIPLAGIGHELLLPALVVVVLSKDTSPGTPNLAVLLPLPLRIKWNKLWNIRHFRTVNPIRQ